MRASSFPADCPCGRASLLKCCGPYLSGLAHAATAEALMRSRYSAYALGRRDYLLSTWHASTRPEDSQFALDEDTRWLGLELRKAKVLDDDHAEVEFVARYRQGSRGYRLHELSRFVREDLKWTYVDGQHLTKNP